MQGVSGYVSFKQNVYKRSYNYTVQKRNKNKTKAVLRKNQFNFNNLLTESSKDRINYLERW